MPEKADISRTLLLPFMSIILLVAVYMTANVLLPLKASGKGSKERIVLVSNRAKDFLEKYINVLVSLTL